MARILVVDDDLGVLRLMVRAVEQMGHQALGAETAAAAKASDGPWDLMLVDLGLPDGDGIEVAQHRPEVPVVFVSGRENADLRKPFTTRQLRDVVQARLAREFHEKEDA